jgi:putative flippase GtrA
MADDSASEPPLPCHIGCVSPLQDWLTRPKISELRQRPGVRYVVVGSCTYAFELVVLVLAQRAGASAILAVAISFWLGLLVSFTLQKLVAFGDTRTHHRVILPQIASFSLLVLFNFGFTILVTKLFQHDLPTVVIRTLALGVTTIWNFYLYKTRIFSVPVID